MIHTCFEHHKDSTKNRTKQIFNTIFRTITKKYSNFALAKKKGENF